MALSRRNFVRNTLVTGAAVGSGAALFSNRSKRAHGTPRLVVSGWGGATQRAMREAFFDPFTESTGIQVVEQVLASQGLAQLQAQSSAGKVEIDLLDGAPFWPHIGYNNGLLDQIHLPGLETGDYLDGALTPFCFGYAIAAWGLAFIRKNGNAPENWADFWNVDDFPGRRSLFGRQVERHPEYALMARGESIKGVNPMTTEKIDRGFAKLAELLPAIKVWYETPAQAEQLVLNKSIDMIEMVNGRAFALQDYGVPIEFVWNQSIANTMVFVLAKEAPNREHALTFLQFIAQPEPQAEFARRMFYSPTNRRALSLIADERILARLPTHPPNVQGQMQLDVEWWAQNIEQLSQRWNQLISA